MTKDQDLQIVVPILGRAACECDQPGAAASRRQRRACNGPPSERRSDPTNALIAWRSAVSVPFKQLASCHRNQAERCVHQSCAISSSRPATYSLSTTTVLATPRIIFVRSLTLNTLTARLPSLTPSYRSVVPGSRGEWGCRPAGRSCSGRSCRSWRLVVRSLPDPQCPTQGCRQRVQPMLRRAPRPRSSAYGSVLGDRGVFLARTPRMSQPWLDSSRSFGQSSSTSS